MHNMKAWRTVGLLLSAVTLAGCRETPQSAAVAGPAKRELTDVEKQTVVHAVSLKVKDVDPGRFVWPPLIVKTRDGGMDYCGALSALKKPSRLGGTVVVRYTAELFLQSQLSAPRAQCIQCTFIVHTRLGK